MLLALGLLVLFRLGLVTVMFFFVVLVVGLVLLLFRR